MVVNFGTNEYLCNQPGCVIQCNNQLQNSCQKFHFQHKRLENEEALPLLEKMLGGRPPPFLNSNTNCHCVNAKCPE